MGALTTTCYSRGPPPSVVIMGDGLLLTKRAKFQLPGGSKGMVPGLFMVQQQRLVWEAQDRTAAPTANILLSTAPGR